MNKLKNTSFQDKSVFLPLISAPISEFISILFYIPFDTVRTRMQALTNEYKYKNAFDGIKQIYRSEGMLRLFSA